MGYFTIGESVRESNKVVYVAGHSGMVGSAICRVIDRKSYKTIITRSHSELDLTRQKEVDEFFCDQNIDEVYLAAAKVGGVYANNKYAADFIYENLMIECNVIRAAHRSGVRKLLLLGSSCIYPKMATQPMAESALMTGTLEPTNEPYAVAKIAGIKLCESFYRQYGCDYRSVMPTSLYGPNDNFHPENSHVIPALMRRLHEAKVSKVPMVTIWGSGSPRREFMHVDDMAEACVHVMELPEKIYRERTLPMQSHLNIGIGKDCSIRELSLILKEIVGYEGALEFDASKPDGAPRKLLDVSLLNSLGWKPRISLEDGLRSTYAWYLANSKHS